MAGTALLLGTLGAGPALGASTSLRSPSSAHHSTIRSAFESIAAKSMPKTFKAGTYIVRLKDAPAATYAGGITGFGATKPSEGKQLDAHTSAVKHYSAHLVAIQKSVAAKLGITAFYHYSIAFNGFAAKLTVAQAIALAKNPLVSTLTPNTMLKVQTEDPALVTNNSLTYLKVDGATGVWSKHGGPDAAGKGVVLGDIDTGIAPENPSFAGDPLTSTPSTTVPYIASGNVSFTKADGHIFSSPIDPDAADTSVSGWTSSLLSTKIVAAHYFVDGFDAANLGTTAARGEYLSPRDGAGHGSHTASTAAGDWGVSAAVTVNGAPHNFHGISGVAPAAKIAVYKVCWDGVATDESQDGCASSDMVAAIDQAVSDGVDVLNFSIGGSSATTVFSPTDEAFYNAASAGIFVAAAGGNSGNGGVGDASTLDNAAPWETTVAASTIPSYEATLRVNDGPSSTPSSAFVGASISVNDDSATHLSNVQLVLASDIPSGGTSAADALACGTGTLNPSGAAGKIVVCERQGVVARLESSQTVADAGGVGVVLINSSPNDVDGDAHSIPTIHLDSDALSSVENLAHNNFTASFLEGNLTGTPTQVPQVAGFSSRGPVLSDGSDVLKPDVAAPGVGIVAAVANGPLGGLNPTPKWDFYSGTSMATPHVAGLALLYLGVHPTASVSEIKSALMTTATNTVDSAGVAATDPFAQGAGEVNPTNLLTPGLVYLSTTTDWNNYLYSVQEVTHSDPRFALAKTIDPSNLNQASIAIGDFPGSQIVTRTVTARTAGTYKASVHLTGIKAVVSPSVITFTKAGQHKTFKIILTRTSAPLENYTSGFLTWKRTSGGISVRSPIAIHPSRVTGAGHVDLAGVTGSAKIPLVIGINQSVNLIPLGLAKAVLSTPTGPAGGQYSDTATSGGHQVFYHPFSAATFTNGTEWARFNVIPVPADPSPVSPTDLDLYVAYYATGESIPTPDLSSTDASSFGAHLVGISASQSNNETVDIPTTSSEYQNGGTFVTYVDYFAAPPSGTHFAETFTNLEDLSFEGGFNPTSFTLAGGVNKHTSYTVAWDGLDSNAKYFGIIFYYGPIIPDDFAGGTLFDLSTVTPVVRTVPTVTGTAKVGNVLTSHPAVWDSPDGALTLSYQWLSDGVALGGETAVTHTLTSADLGHKISVAETAAVGAGASATATSAAVTVAKATSSTTFTFTNAHIAHTVQGHVTVALTVTNAGSVPPAGDAILTIKYGSKVLHAPIVNGVADVDLPLLKKGKYAVSVWYPGVEEIAASHSAVHYLYVS